MNIFLEAFVDTNFGDNLFVHTVVSRYPQHTFHMLPRKGYETSYQLLLEQENNIQLISPEKAETFITEMNAMMVVGGDMFWEGTYLTWLKYVRAIKKEKGPVIFMGMSLFPQYSFKTRFFLRLLFHQVDAIVVRETQSAEQAKKIAPKAAVITATDMAFTTDVTDIKKEAAEAGVLGISVRKKIPRDTKDAYAQYCACMAETAVSYLEEDDTHTIRFLALSKGVFDDEAVAKEILALCPEKYRARMQMIPFKGNVTAYIQEMQKCEKLLCTRFHALVFAILLRKPFVPVIYEEKMRRLLNEIGYEGIRPEYEDQWSPEDIRTGFEECYCEEEKLASYLNKAGQFFVASDAMIKIIEKARAQK